MFLFQLTSEDLSYFSHPKPFKNPHYDRKLTGTISSKRNKTLKQILVLERERIDKVLQSRKLEILGEGEQGGQEGMQIDGTGEEEMKLTEEEKEERRKKKEKQEIELMNAFSQVVSCEFLSFLFPLGVIHLVRADEKLNRIATM